MIPTPTLVSFSLELQKLAYGEKEHVGLAGVATRGSGGSSKGVRGVIAKGSKQVDEGARHPWLPHTDNLHSFPGSQSRGQVGKNVVHKQEQAVSDIAHSIARNHRARGQGRIRGTINRARSSASGYRGLKNMGEASHQLADVSAHYDKPQHLGVASRLRKKAPGIGYGGGVVSGREHQRAGLKGLSSKLDELKPSASSVDAQVVRRQSRLGSSTAKKVQKRLVTEHGFHPSQAAAAHHEFMHSPGFSRAGRVVGEATRDAKYVKGEATRALETGAGALRRGARRLLRR